MRDRLIILMFFRVGDPPIIVGLVIPWVYLEAGEVRDRLIISALLG